MKHNKDAFRYSYSVVNLFGILGNILVILSLLRRKNILKNNYYFLVLQLAICDLLVLIIFLYVHIERYWLEGPISAHSPTITCHATVFIAAFQIPGVGMMLTISVLRYRATVHPLKPAISRKKLKVACGLLYLVGLIAACGVALPLCFIKSNVQYVAYLKFFYAWGTIFTLIVPTIFLGVVYYRIGQSLIKQNKYMKRVCSNQLGRRVPDSFNILKHIRNRRTYLVCLITVLCFGVGIIPMSVCYIGYIAGQGNLNLQYSWFWYFARVLRLAGSHSINPLIYGILDKKLLTFWKCCSRQK